MATAPSMRSGGARVYSQSGDIDQLLEDAWVPESRGRGNEQRSNFSYQRQPEPQTTEKERILMAQLEEARRQLQELGRLPGVQGQQNQGRDDYGGGRDRYGRGRDGYDGGRDAYGGGRDAYGGPRDAYGGPRDAYGGPRDGYGGGRDGYGGGDRQDRAWNSNMGGTSQPRGDNSHQQDSWDNSCGSSSGSRSTPTHSDCELSEPLYVNTEEIAASAAAARAPVPPPRNRLPPPTMAAAPLSTPIAASPLPVQIAKVAPTAGPIQSYHHQHNNEKASSSKHEESFEMKESVSVFQVFPPPGSTSGGSLPSQRSAPPPPLQPQSPLQPAFPQQQPMVSTLHRDGLSHNFPSQPHNGGGMSPGNGVFRFPPQDQKATMSQSSWHNHSQNQGVTSTSRGQVTAASSASANHQSSSLRSEQYHSHSSEHPSAPMSLPPSSQRPIGQEWSNSSAANRTEHQHSSHQHSSHQAYRSESSHASSNSHSITQQQRKEAASSSERQSQGASDVYSETSSLKPIGAGIHTLRSHTALHKLRQTNSGFQIGTSRLKTLNLSTPQLDRSPPAAAFKSDQQLAAPPQQHIGIGQLRGSTPHVAATNASMPMLPMAFMIAMPTNAVSLQQLNMFSGATGFPVSAFPTMTATTAQTQHQQQIMHAITQGQQIMQQEQHPMMQQAHHQEQHHRSVTGQHQVHQQSNRTFRTSRSMERGPQQMASISARSSNSSSAGGFRIVSGNRAGHSLMAPQIVIDTASSSGGSSLTIHAADFEAEEKPYVELSSLRPAGVPTSSATARRSQSSTGVGADRSGAYRVELLRSSTSGAANRRLSSADDTVFNNATYATATLQASAMEPRNSFMRASLSSRQQQQQQQQQQQLQYNSPGSFTPTRRFSGNSGGGSTAGGDYDPPPSPGGLLRFENDTSQFWYKPNISRSEAINFLRPLPPGRFVVRDSTSFPGAYGLAIKVAEVPPGTASSDSPDDLVRHFLIEQTTKGVRIHGCSEPVFASLAALIYQHTVMPLSLPCKLTLPEATDAVDSTTDMAVAAGSVDPRVILEHGAACNVLYLGATDIESLTGAGGLSRAVDALLRNRDRLRSCVCQLKVAKDGISLTDIERRQFFRKHYPAACVLHCAMDPQQRCYESGDTKSRGMNSKIFGFVARKNPGSQENTAVVMCEIEQHQPAEAVVRFVSKYLIGRR